MTRLTPEKTKSLLKTAQDCRLSNSLRKTYSRYDSTTSPTFVIPINKTLSYELQTIQIKEILDAVQPRLWEIVTGVIVFGSSVNAKYHYLKRKRLFGLLETRQKTLVYENKRTPNDIDILILLDQHKLKKSILDLDKPFTNYTTNANVISYKNNSYSGLCKITETQTNGLDVCLTTPDKLIKELKEQNEVAQHIQDVGITILGESPIKLLSTNYFTQQNDSFKLQFDTHID